MIGGHSTGSKPPVDEARFGVIGAWDGHRVDRGRVVVDATWHHFFNINLTGQVDSSNADKRLGFYGPRPAGQPDHYESIKWYFRNIVYWLVPKNRVVYTLREAILVAAHSGPYFEEFPHWREGGYRGPFDWHFVWDVSQITKAYFEHARGGCYWLQVIDIILIPLPQWRKWWEELAPLFDPWFPKPGKLPRPRPWMDPRMAADAAVVLDAIIGAHTLATLEAAGRVGVKGREKLHAEADALLDKYLHASLAEAAKALAAARRELSPMHKALVGLQQ